jgi:spore coat polysaccharide biosynthesis protein SpsF
MHSTRLPRKAFADIHGRSLIGRLVDRLRAARSLDRIVICTSSHPDDEVLVGFAEAEGLEVVAGSERDVLSRFMAAAARFGASAVVRVTGDNVLTDPGIVDQLVTRHVAAAADYTRANGLPLGAAPEVLAAAILPRLHDMMPDPNESEYLMLYAFDPVAFRCEVLPVPEQLRRPYYSVSVDTPADLELVRGLYRLAGQQATGPSLEEIVRALDAHPPASRLTDATPIRMPGGRTRPYGELLARLEDRARAAGEKPARPA